MWEWAQIILAVIRLVEWLVEQGQKHKWITEGEQRAIARSLAEVTRKQEFGREILSAIESLPDAAVDELLRELATGERQLLSDLPEGAAGAEGRVDSSIQSGEGSSRS